MGNPLALNNKVNIIILHHYSVTEMKLKEIPRGQLQLPVNEKQNPGAREHKRLKEPKIRIYNGEIAYINVAVPNEQASKGERIKPNYIKNTFDRSLYHKDSKKQIVISNEYDESKHFHFFLKKLHIHCEQRKKQYHIKHVI